jgi:hypothetical protein
MAETKRIDQIEQLIRGVIHASNLTPLGDAHLQRAAAHVREAWQAEAGHTARSVAAVTSAMIGFENLLIAAAKKREEQDRGGSQLDS